MHRSGLPYTEPEAALDQSEKVKVLTRAQLGDFLRVAHPEWKLFFEFLASTGLRWSEAIALQWKHVDLNTASAPTSRSVAGFVGAGSGPPKSKNAVRDVPLSWTVADGLRKNVGDEEGLVFPSAAGVPLNHSNTYRRKLLPAAEEADVAWATIHTFRHTCASLLFARVAM